MNDYHRLRVWHKAHTLVLAVYRATSAFPSSERFGLIAQMRRAAVSVPANLAESCGRRGGRDEARLRQIAFGSATELEYELELARDLAYVSPTDHAALQASLVEVKRMLAALVLRGDVRRQTSGDRRETSGGCGSLTSDV